MDKDNTLYLKKIAKRTNYYGSVKKKALRYIHKNKISNKAIRVNILLISAIWAAQQLNHDLREDDLLIFPDLVTVMVGNWPSLILNAFLSL